MKQVEPAKRVPGTMGTLTRSCGWCGAATTVMGRRFGTMCEECFQIEENIGVGISVWREARARELAKPIRAVLSRHTIYEHDEIRTALDLVASEWADEWLGKLTRLDRHRGEI